jgi:hypothetical protein
MSPLTISLYVLLTTLAIFGAQFSAVNTYKDALGTVAVSQLRDVLNGLAVYTVNNWNDLILTTPSPIAYTNPLTQTSVNVVNIKSPTADELMMLGFLPSPKVTSTTYSKPTLGSSFKTLLSITPAACTGNACSINLYVYFTTPVAKTNGQFDSHLISTAINTTSTSMGYTFPNNPTTVVGFNNAWTYQMAAGTLSGMAMIHTSIGTNFFNANYPCVENGCWKSPVLDLTKLPLLKNSLGDIRMVTSLGTAYSWTGAFWNALNTNSLNSAFIGQSSGNTGSNNVYVGANSASHFYVGN